MTSICHTAKLVFLFVIIHLVIFSYGRNADRCNLTISLSRDTWDSPQRITDMANRSSLKLSCEYPGPVLVALAANGTLDDNYMALVIENKCVIISQNCMPYNETCAYTVLTQRPRHIFECNRFRYFWISWTNDTVSIGKGQKPGSNDRASYTNNTHGISKVNYIFLSKPSDNSFARCTLRDPLPSDSWLPSTSLNKDSDVTSTEPNTPAHDYETTDVTTESNTPTDDYETTDVTTTESNTPTDDYETTDVTTTESNTPTDDYETTDATTTESNTPTDDYETTDVTTTESNTPTDDYETTDATTTESNTPTDDYETTDVTTTESNTPTDDYETTDVTTTESNTPTDDYETTDVTTTESNTPTDDYETSTYSLTTTTNAETTAASSTKLAGNSRTPTTDETSSQTLSTDSTTTTFNAITTAQETKDITKTTTTAWNVTTTTGNATTPQNSTKNTENVTATATPVTRVKYTREQCHCKCVKEKRLSNMTAEERQEMEETKKRLVQEIKQNLTLPKANLSAIRRRYISARDDRTSSKYVAMVLAVFCFSPMAIIVLCDCIRFLVFLYKVGRRCLRRFGK